MPKRTVVKYEQLNFRVVGSKFSPDFPASKLVDSVALQGVRYKWIRNFFSSCCASDLGKVILEAESRLKQNPTDTVVVTGLQILLGDAYQAFADFGLMREHFFNLAALAYEAANRIESAAYCYEMVGNVEKAITLLTNLHKKRVEENEDDVKCDRRIRHTNLASISHRIKIISASAVPPATQACRFFHNSYITGYTPGKKNGPSRVVMNPDSVFMNENRQILSPTQEDPTQGKRRRRHKNAAARRRAELAAVAAGVSLSPTI